MGGREDAERRQSKTEPSTASTVSPSQSRESRFDTAGPVATPVLIVTVLGLLSSQDASVVTY